MNAEELCRRLTAEPSTTGLFCDFDGTLAPIVDDPTRSAMPDELRPVLAGLAARLAVVAVVSGRPVSFLAERAAVPGVRLLGLYGLEEWVDGEVRARPEAEAWREAVAAARGQLREATADLPGVRVEDKGLSVAVHWRNAADRDAAAGHVDGLIRRLAADTGLAPEPGKLVAELRPPVDWDKGAGVAAAAAEAGLAEVAYLGDDLGDLSAFVAVRRLGGVAVAVDHGPETPGQVRAAADVVIDGAPAVAELLHRLLGALRR